MTSTIAATDLPERRWAMIKLAPGDWLCWSNDRTQVWRFHTYVDGAVHGLLDGQTGEPVPYEERTYWRTVWMWEDRFTEFAKRDAIPEAWEPAWTEDDWYLPTRKAAIDRMLAAGDPT